MTMNQKELTFHECCRIVLEQTTAKFWAAKSYAKRGLTIDEHDISAIRSQAQYILSNLGNWRGSRAQEVKAWLRVYGKQDPTSWLGHGAEYGKQGTFGKGRGKSGVK